MKAIFIAGFIAVFILGVIGFLLKVIFLDVPSILLKPLIVNWLGAGWWTMPLTIVFTVAIILIVGIILHRFKLQKTVNAVLEKIIPTAELTVLLKIAPGVDCFAIKLKEITQKKPDDTTKIRCVLFAPYAPVPGSGLPIILADKDKVTPLKISLRQLISIIISFGRNIPDVLNEGTD